MTRRLLLLVLLLALHAAAAGAAERVQIVLDASGSMWGRVGDEPKIDVARGVIREMLEGWDPSVEIGLTAYGHRRKGDCADIETLVPAGPLDAAAFMGAVNGLQPKGKTPLTAAVTRAAEELRYTEERAAVVLVSDGLETCHADPCAAAAALEEAGVDLTVHVVGFDLKEGEDQKLRCIAERTGGSFWLAEDAAGLTDAFAEVVQVVAAPTPTPAPPAPAPRPTFEGVKLVPLLSEGGEVLESGVEWKVLAPEPDFEGNREQRAYQWNAGTQIFTLAPGTHLVQVRYGDVARERTIEVETGDGETFEFVLDGARLRVTALLAEGAMELSGVEWKILDREPDFEGNRRQIAYQWNAAPGHVFTIPAGTYDLQAAYANASGAATFTVEPGEQKALTLPLGAAQLRLDAVLAAGGEPVSGVEWKLLGLEEDFEGNRQQVAYQWNAGPGHIFTVPAGSYELFASYGNVTRSAPISLAAGERTRHGFDLEAGQVKLDLLPGGEHAPLPGVEWKVLDASGARVAYQWNAAPGHGFTLPAGSYRVEATGGGFVGRGSFTVGAGEQKRVAVVGTPGS